LHWGPASRGVCGSVSGAFQTWNDEGNVKQRARCCVVCSGVLAAAFARVGRRLPLGLDGAAPDGLVVPGIGFAELGVGSVDERSRSGVEREGDAEERRDGDVAFAAVDLTDEAPVEAGRTGQLFLAEAELGAARADRPPQENSGLGIDRKPGPRHAGHVDSFPDDGLYVYGIYGPPGLLPGMYLAPEATLQGRRLLVKSQIFQSKARGGSVL